MIRISAFVWIVVLGLLGVGLFQVKYNVQSKEAELRRINKQIDANRSAIHVLDAEWSYLNDPTRLADLTRRHTDLTPTQATQLKHFSDLPARPASAQPDLPALSSIAPAIAAPTAPAVATTVAPAQPTVPAAAPATVAPATVVPASATAGSVPTAAPAVASTIAATPAAKPTAKPAAAQATAAQPAAAKAAATSVTKPGADEVIDAILADMQRQQGGNAQPQAGDQ